MTITTNPSTQTHTLTADTEHENNIVASIHDFVASCPGISDSVANLGGYTREGRNYCTLPFRAPAAENMTTPGR